MKPVSRVGFIAGITVFLVAMGGGVSYALWSAGASTSAAVKAATVILAVDGAPAVTELSVELRPAEPVTSSVTLTNGGSAPLQYSIAVEPLGGSLDPAKIQVALWEETAAYPCASGSSVPVNAWTGTLKALAAHAGVELLESEVRVLCIRADLAGADSDDQGDSISARFRFTGENRWLDDDNVVVIQPSVFTVPEPTVAAQPCVSMSKGAHGSDKEVKLSWSGTSGPYRVYFSPTSYQTGNGTSAIISGESFTFDGTNSAVTATVYAIADNGWLSEGLEFTLWPGSQSTPNTKIYCEKQVW